MNQHDKVWKLVREMARDADSEITIRSGAHRIRLRILLSLGLDITAL